MSFAYIQEAWAGGQGGGKKKKRNTTEQFDDIADRYMYTNKQPKERTTTYRPTVIEQSKGAVYDVTADDAYTGQLSFMDYDDFFKSDFQYTSLVDEPPPRQEYEPPQPRVSVLPEVQHVREPFMNHASPRVTTEQMYIELVLYTLTGFFLILILEQFLQLGSKIA